MYNSSWIWHFKIRVHIKFGKIQYVLQATCSIKEHICWKVVNIADVCLHFEHIFLLSQNLICSQVYYPKTWRGTYMKFYEFNSISDVKGDENSVSGSMLLIYLKLWVTTIFALILFLVRVQPGMYCSLNAVIKCLSQRLKYSLKYKIKFAPAPKHHAMKMPRGHGS